jgi:hypothetical protein
MNPDLLRQRRNLIAISTFLVLFDVANVQIAKVSLLGNELIIGNVRVLIYSAWCLWGYFLLRYYQYWRAEPDQHIRKSFAKHLDSLARTYTQVQAVQDSMGQAFNDYKITRTGFLSWSYTLQGYNPGQGSVVDLKTSPLPLWRLFFWNSQSAMHVGLHTPHATDHILPFAVAIAAPIVGVITKLPPPWSWLWALPRSQFCI